MSDKDCICGLPPQIKDKFILKLTEFLREMKDDAKLFCQDCEVLAQVFIENNFSSSDFCAKERAAAFVESCKSSYLNYVTAYLEKRSNDDS